MMAGVYARARLTPRGASESPSVRRLRLWQPTANVGWLPGHDLPAAAKIDSKGPLGSPRPGLSWPLVAHTENGQAAYVAARGGGLPSAPHRGHPGSAATRSPGYPR